MAFCDALLILFRLARRFDYNHRPSFKKACNQAQGVMIYE